MINRLVIIGVGLMGGSLALALRAAGRVGEIVGYGRGLTNLQDAVDRRVIDRVATSLGSAVREADVVVLATPVGAMGDSLAEIAPFLTERSVVTDVGSVKTQVVSAARVALGERFARFVPGHPLAGGEKSGVGAAHAELYRGQRVILTPEAETDAQATERVAAMWESVGAEVRRMPAGEHDAILAATSHLPHLLAFTLIDLLARAPQRRSVFEYSGNGLRDMTRIAASDPVMWRDICLANRDAILAALADYRGELEELAAAIEGGDGARLLDLFARAQRTREGLG
jgi:prephenate dehydrogenase